MGKRKTNNSESKDATAVSMIASGEENFPRGGASALTPLEHREISNKVAQDLFKTTSEPVVDVVQDDSDDNTDEPVKKKKKPSKKDKKKTTAAAPATSKVSDSVYMEQLNFKKITVGTSLLGCISHINELDLFVSLPSQLVGVVSITEISDAFTAQVEKAANAEDDEDEDMDESSLPSLDKVFRVGQWVRTRVTAVQSEKEQKKLIELSLKPNYVNEDIAKVDVTPGVTLGATIKSVEDHGYIIDLGVKGLTGFLPTKEAKSYISKYNDNQALITGQYIECAIEKADGRTANVTIDRSKVGAAIVEDPFSRITSILPGQLVRGLVEAVQANGVSVKMQGLYHTTIDSSHIPITTEIEKDYKMGQSVTFRTLFTMINTEEKRLGGILLPHALKLDAPVLVGEKMSEKYMGDVFPAGTILDNIKVARVHSLGVHAAIDGLDGVAGYVHVSRLDDGHSLAPHPTSGKFKLGSTHRARVLSYNPVDAVLILTAKPSDLADNYFRITDIQVGAMVECEVLRLDPIGVFVRLSKNIQGLIHTMHMADVTLTRPEYKFKPGKRLQARVLSTDPDRSRVSLTLKKSLINSDLPMIQSIDNCQVDMTSHGVITKIMTNGCLVTYYNNVCAFAPGNEMTETHIANLGDVFKVGQTVKTYVLKVDHETRKMLVSFINSKGKAEKAAEKKAKSDAKYAAKHDDLAPGKVVDAVIKSVKKTSLVVTLPNSMEGRVHVSEIYNQVQDIKNLKNPLGQFRTKQEIQVKILGVRNIKLKTYLPISHAQKTKTHIDCSLRLDTNNETDHEIHHLKSGDEFIGFVSDIHANYIHVSIGTHTTGVMQKQLVSSDLNICNNIAKHFISGQAMRVAVVSVDTVKNSIELMNVEDASTPRITQMDDLQVGQIMNGVVKYINKNTGISVSVIGKISGKAYLTDLSDTYTDDPTSSFSEGQVVRFAIIHLNIEKHQVDISLRPSRLFPDISSAEIKTFEDIKRGIAYEGYVSNVAPSGVFVKLNHEISVRVKIANLSDAFVKEWKDIYTLGQRVKVKVIYIDYDMKRLEGTLKKSIVENSTAATSASSSKSGNKGKKSEATAVDSDSDEEMLEVDEDDSEDETMQDVAEQDSQDEDEQNDDNEVSDDNDTSTAEALKIDNFDWTGINNRVDSSDEESSDSDSDSDIVSKKKKQEVVDKTADLNTETPQTANDFERFLIGSPNSSYLWINYMAYQLQLSEIAKAREIGERALKTIHYREEQEKMNVWVALLNLENNFGTTDTLDETFKRAILYCDPLKVYLQLVKIYERSEKSDKAELLWEEMSKKFGSQSVDVWTGYRLFYLKSGQADKAREVLTRCTNVLPKPEHVGIMAKFGQMEFKHGEAEIGRTILEGVLSNNPKRLDLWSVYLDMEIKNGDDDMTRRLFERVASMKFSSKKMKFLFKKWLQFEKANGTEDTVQRVKDRTLAYVESMS